MQAAGQGEGTGKEDQAKRTRRIMKSRLQIGAFTYEGVILPVLLIQVNQNYAKNRCDNGREIQI
jgi:hypothetical protein